MEMDRKKFWDNLDDTMVFKDTRALFREAISRVFSPSLNTIAVATKIKELGYSIELLDVALEFGIPFNAIGIERRYEKFSHYLEKHFPNFGVFISSLSARDHCAIRRIALEIKKIGPKCPVILGGYHANACASDLLADPNIDFIVMGDFEPVAKKVLDFLVSPHKINAKDIPNFCLKDQEGNPKIAIRKSFKPQDILSRFDFEIVDRYLPMYDMLGMVSSKGCLFSCKFCSERIVRDVYAELPPLEAASMAIGILNQFEKKTGRNDIGFYFMDALFSPSHIRDLAQTFNDLGSPLHWTFQTRVDLLHDCDFGLLRRSGCYLINVGLESLSPSMLLRLGKTQHPMQYLGAFRKILEKANQEGIDVEFNILFGAPGETRETLAETRRGIEATVKEFPTSSVNLNLFRLFPESQSYVEAGKLYGSEILIPNWWLTGIIPEITVTVKPSTNLLPDDLIGFYEQMYSTDVCYRRRGSLMNSEKWLREGQIPVDALRPWAEEKRETFLSKLSAKPT